MHGLLPWAVAGLAGWLGTKLIHVNEEWVRAIMAALFGALSVK